VTLIAFIIALLGALGADGRTQAKVCKAAGGTPDAESICLETLAACSRADADGVWQPMPCPNATRCWVHYRGCL
jgi:hypothetical protein